MTELLGALSLADDGAVVAFDRRYDTDAADLWQAVTDPDRLARWFAPVAGELREGGEFTITFDDGDIPRCRVVACDAPSSYAWEWPHGDRASLVEVVVEPDGDGSRLLLTHRRLGREQAPEYAAGWDAYVRRLDDDRAGREPRDSWWDDFGATRAAYAEALE